MAASARRRRAVLLTLLALAAPLPAFALSSDGPGMGSATPTTLNVSTTLGSCGLAGTEIVCELKVAYDTVSGASRYTASVTRADGSVVDYGNVGAGSASLYVPYVGRGSYSVRITAYGSTPEEGGRGQVLATGSDPPVQAEVSGARGNNSIGKRKPGNRISRSEAAQASEANNPGNPGVQGGAPPPAQPEQQQAAEAPPTTTTTSTTTTTTPACVDPSLNPLPPDDNPNNDDEDGDGVSDAEELAAAAGGQQLTLQVDPSADC